MGIAGSRRSQPLRAGGQRAADRRRHLRLARCVDGIALPGGSFPPLAADRKAELRGHLLDQLGIVGRTIWAQGAFDYQRPGDERACFSGFYSVWEWDGEPPEDGGYWLDASEVAASGLPPSLKILLTSVPSGAFRIATGLSESTALDVLVLPVVFEGDLRGVIELASLDRFNPETGLWEELAPMPRPRGGVNGVAAFGCFFVWGGEGANTGEPNDVFPDHDVYDPQSDSWTSLADLPTPIHGVTGAAFVDGLIDMPGGGTAQGGSSGSTIFQVYRPALRCD